MDNRLSFFYDKENEKETNNLIKSMIKEYFINPGELIFSKKPVILKTVLGSCVAVILYDKILKYAGLCHYLLPIAPADEYASTKYGNIAIKVLLNKFFKNFSKIENIVAYIIGGAFVVFDEREIFFIGDRNVEVAQNILKKNDIYIKAMNTGGDYGRRVIYNSLIDKLYVENLSEINIDDLYKNK